MDPIDRGIILDLQRNYRVSLRALADKHGVTSKAIRRRIAALEEKGVIRDYLVQLSRAMTN
ncbi:MAG: winged helix-turn-helix transcriptional regulator, partial [Candidatus Thorarchaeota archaeon]